MKRKQTARLVVLLLIIVTTGFIWWQSLRNSDTSQQASGAVKQLLVSVFGDSIQSTPFYINIRKVAHFVEFAVLGAEWCGFILLGGDRKRWWLLLTGVFTAGCDEWLQFLSPGRTPRFADVLLDCAGYACGAAAIWLTVLLWQRYRRHNR